MVRCVCVVLFLFAWNGNIAQAADHNEPKSVKISDSIFMAPAGGNVYTA